MDAASEMGCWHAPCACAGVSCTELVYPRVLDAAFLVDGLAWCAGAAMRCSAHPAHRSLPVRHGLGQAPHQG